MLETKLVGIAEYSSLRLTPDQHARAIERANDHALVAFLKQRRDAL